MSDPIHDEERQNEIDRIVREYYQLLEEGNPPDPATFLSAYPEYASELSSFIADVVHMAGPPPIAQESAVAHTVDLAAVISSHGGADGPRTSEFIRDYLLIKKLGEGGFGAVYLAVHTELDKRVAIKMLKSEKVDDAKSVERFRREIKAAGRLEHDHIVRAFDAGKIEGVHFLVMEYIDGCDLSELVASCGPLRVADACEIIRQSAMGLEHAHKFGLVHRDVKPSNLMLTADGQVKLLDLGLAQLRERYHRATELTLDGQALGTLKYMAPEQFEDCRSVTSACDVFSLGVTLHELLRGGLPAGRLDLKTDYADLKPHRKDVPHDLSNLIGEMTASDPAERLDSAGEAAERLSEWSHGHNLASIYGDRHSDGRKADQVIRSSRALPTSNERLNPLSHLANFASSKWGMAFGVTAILAACIFAIPLALGLPELNKQESIATAPQYCELIIESMDDVDPDWSNKFTGHLKNLSTRQMINLGYGLNQIEPGEYLFDPGEWKTNVADSFALYAGDSLIIHVSPPTASTRLDFHRLYAKLPEQTGAWAKFRAGLSFAQQDGEDRKANEQYDVELRALDKVEVEGKTYRHLEVSVSGSGYEETCWVLVDYELYESNKEFEIHGGYLQGKLTDDVKGIPDIVGDTFPAVWSNREDPMEAFEKQWRFQWPANRVGCISLLAILFDYKHPSVPPEIQTLRSRVGVAETQSIEPMDRFLSTGNIQTVRFSTWEDIENRDSPYGYVIEKARNSNEAPFSFIAVEIEDPFLNVSFLRAKDGETGAKPLPDFEVLEAAIARLDQLATPIDETFWLANLPQQPGSFCEYSGEIKLGQTPDVKTTVGAELRVGNREKIDGRTGIWLEIVVSNTNGSSLDGRRVESAKILIDEERYRNQDEFHVLGGWYELNDEVFEFGDGDAGVAERSLQWLGKPARDGRFKVHDVLSLLFDADFPSASRTRHLRTAITELISLTEGNRAPRLCEIVAKPRSGLLTFVGHEWTLSPTDGPAIHYRVQHSPEIQFGFGRVEVASPDGSFDVSTRLLDSGQDLAPLLGSHDQLSRLADETESSIHELGVRIWNTKDGQFVAKFNEYLRDNVDLVLVPGSDEVQVYPWSALSEDDQDWVLRTQAREWKWTDASGSHTERALFYGPKSMSDAGNTDHKNYAVLRLSKTNRLQPVVVDSLSPADRAFFWNPHQRESPK